MSWIHRLIAGAQEEQQLRGLRSDIEALAAKGRVDPDANVAGRLTKLRRRHFDMTGCGGPP